MLVPNYTGLTKLPNFPFFPKLAFIWRSAPILASHVFLVMIFVDGQTGRHTEKQTDNEYSGWFSNTK